MVSANSAHKDICTHDAGRVIVASAALLRSLESEGHQSNLSRLLSSKNKNLVAAIDSLVERSESKNPQLRRMPLHTAVSEKVLKNRNVDLNLARLGAFIAAKATVFAATKNADSAPLRDQLANAYFETLISNGRATQRRAFIQLINANAVNGAAIAGVGLEKMRPILESAQAVSLERHTDYIAANYRDDDDLTM